MRIPGMVSAVRAPALAAGLIIAVMAGAVAFSSSPVGGVAGFGDIDEGRFYTEPVQWMVDEEITTGTSATCFSPDEEVTRGQAAAFLWRMEGRPTGSPAHPFDDVVAPWQQEPVSWMAAEGITTGTSATTYSPDDPLTRGQFAALLHRLEGSPPAEPSGFPDVTTSWQIVPVGWLSAEGITTGTSPTTFSPEETATRGQIAAFLHRYKESPAVVIDPASPFCAPPTTTTTTTTTTAPPAPSGRSVFVANCAVCHGSSGGGGFGPNLIGNTLSYSAIRSQVVNGGGGMPSFGGRLSGAEIDAVSGYVSGL